MSARDLVFEIFAIDRASATFSKVGTEAEAMGAKVSKGNKVATEALMGAGVVMGALGVKSLELSAQFESSTQRFTTTAGESAKGLEKVRKGILDMAGQVGFTAEELSQAMYFVESGGYHGAKGLNVLKAAAQGAAVEGSDVTEVAHALAGALNDYHGTSLSAVTATNAMTAAVGSGMMTFNDLAEALPKIGSRAAAAHVSFEEMLAGLGTMTKDGLPAAVAATYLGQSIGQLAAPTQKAQKEMEALHLNSSKVSAAITSGSGHGLADAIKMLWDASSRAGSVGQTQVQALANMAGGVKSYQGVLMLGGPHVDQYASSLKAITKQVKDGGTAVDGFAAQQGTLQQKFKDAEGAASSLGVELGNRLQPEAKAALGAFTDFAGFLGDHQTLMTNTVLGVTGLATALGVYKLAAAAAGWVTGTLIGEEAALALQMGVSAVAAGDFAGAMTAVDLAMDANPIGLTVLAIAGVTAGLWGGKAAMDAFHHSTDDSAVAVGDYSAAIDTATGKIDKLTRTQALNAAHQALAKAAKGKMSVFEMGSQVGLNQNVLEHAAIGNVRAINQVLAVQAKYENQLKADSAAGSQRNVDADKAKLAMIKDITNAIDAQTGAIVSNIDAERSQHFGALSATKDLKGLSKATAEAILHNEQMANSTADVAKLADKYHLLPKQIKTVIKAEQVPTTVKAVEHVQKLLRDLPKTKPNMSPYLDSFIKQVLDTGPKAKGAAEKTNKHINDGVTKNKPDLAPWGQALTSSITAQGGPAKSAATGVGADMMDGLLAGFAPAAAALSNEAADAVLQAIAAARAAGQTKSPSRKFMLVGNDMGDGLVVGMNARKPAAESAGANLVKSALHGSKAELKKRAADYKKDISKLTSEIQAATSYATGFGNPFSDVTATAQMQSSQMMIGSQAVDVTAPVPASPGSTLAAMMAYETKQRDQSRKLLADVRKLRKEGVSKNVLAQMEASGPDGLAQIQALASASKAQVRSFSQLDDQATKNSSNAAALMATGKTVGQLRQERSQDQRLEKALDKALKKHVVKVKVVGHSKTRPHG